MTSMNDPFANASNNWDLDSLYKDLSLIKEKPLTPKEKQHLRGLLCGYSPAEIAEKLYKTPKSVETELSTTLYRYIKGLLNKSTDKLENWRHIVPWLEEEGYKYQVHPQSHISDPLPLHSWIKIGSVSIEKDKIMFIGICVRNVEHPYPNYSKPSTETPNSVNNGHSESLFDQEDELNNSVDSNMN